MNLHILPAPTGRHRITTTEAAELRRTAREANQMLTAETRRRESLERQLAASEHGRHDAQAAIATQARIIHAADANLEARAKQLTAAKDTIAALRKRLDEVEAMFMDRSGAEDTQPTPVLQGAVLATPPKPAKPPVQLAHVPTGLPHTTPDSTPVDMPGTTRSVPVNIVKRVA